MAKSVCWHTSSGEVASWSHHASRSKDHWLEVALDFSPFAELVSLKFVLALLVRKEICRGNVSMVGGTGLAQRWYMWVESFCFHETTPPPPTPELYVSSWSKKQHLTNYTLLCAHVIWENSFVLSYVSLWLWLNFYEVSLCCMGEGTYWVLPLRTKLRPFKLTKDQTSPI